MKNKILPLVIIVLIIISFVGGMLTEKGLNHRAIIKELKEKNGGVLPTEEASNKKYTLSGLYMDEEDTQVIVDGGLKQTTRNAITIYSNNKLTIQKIIIYDLDGIGREVIKGMEDTYTYSISVDAKTLLLQQPKRNNSTEISTSTYTFSDDYNTIWSVNKKEFKSYEGGIDDYYTSDELAKDYSNMKKRETDFEGKYLYMTDRGQLQRNYTFNREGIAIYERPMFYGSDDTTIYRRVNYYWIKDNEIFIYKSGEVLKGVLSDDKKSLELIDEERLSSPINLTYKLQ